MCTVSWIRDRHGYQLFCNRDEKLSRGKAEPPRESVRGGVRFLAPIDADFGGTWIATNEFGISVCLLNGALPRISEQSDTTPRRSRGLLVLDLVPSASVDAISELMRESDLSSYAPFTLAALESGQPAAIVEWNGFRTTFRYAAEAHFMLTSSSFDPSRVQTRRREEYLRLMDPREQLTAARFLRFHASHGNGPSAYSTCMHRRDAETVSFSWIWVSDGEARFTYAPTAPCKCDMGITASQPLRLALKPDRRAATPGDAR